MPALVLDALYVLLLLAASPFLAWKAVRTGKYRRNLKAKFFGDPPKGLDPDRPVIWFHAVSLGEVQLLRPLLDRYAAAHPHCQLALSTATDTGYDVAREKYPGVRVFFAPLDFSWALRRTFNALRPKLLVLVELELWPNLLQMAQQRGVTVTVVNARLGERSHRGYSRVRWLLRPSLSAVRWWGAQTEEIAARIRSLTRGLASTVAVTGSMKYDGAPTDRRNPETRRLRALFGFAPQEKIILGGSVQGDEDGYLLDVFMRLRGEHPGLRLVLAPRHPDRFDAVAERVRSAGVDLVRRSEITSPQAKSAAVTILDTVGELRAAWGLADFGYVGGTLRCNRGGQNMIEPAGYGVALVFGNEIWNFQETTDKLLAADAAVRVTNPEELPAVFSEWLRRPDISARLGANARGFVAGQLGAVNATLAALAGFTPAGPSRRLSA
ncbi:MAG TPA: glycosyltransferase N-terminal domain-containing protein [Planctomycetia bacterium]|nr:glycosyltransferase N-terminal domain-containing protein [Planctomycetia bacterium]